MRNQKDDRRTMYSKKAIRESFFELMQERPINKITVKELCDLADVNRSTFYAYYNDIYDLYKQTLKIFFSLQREYINKAIKVMEAKSDLTDLSVPDFYEIALLYLQTVKKNRDVYRFALYGNNNTPVQISFDKVFFHEIKKRLPPQHSEIFRRSFTFISAGTTALLVRWMMEDFATPAEELAKSIAYYYNGVFNGHKFAREQKKYRRG